MPRTLGRLAHLGIHDLHRESGLGRPTAPWLVLQSADPLLLVAVQPQAHHVLATLVDLRNLRHPVAARIQQHHLGAQGHPPDGLSTHLLQVLALLSRQMHPYHPHTSQSPDHTGSVPEFWLPA